MSKQETKQEQVSIEILGRQFTIGTPASEKDTLLQALDMLNDKIRTIKGGGRVIENDKIVVMAALNVVHDLLKLQLKDGLAIGEFERRIGDMVEACNKSLSKVV